MEYTSHLTRLVNGKEYRYGYTTGTCATAAAAAAVRMLLRQCGVECVDLHLPAGTDVRLLVHEVEYTLEWAQCHVVKDAGDDPDVTHGLAIYARAEWNSCQQLCIEGGVGVGRVTKPGLLVEPGKAAINPGPMQQIKAAVEIELNAFYAPASWADKCGITITIFVPRGEEVARQTLNTKLGVVGGISILGTTGVVKPMSEEAFKNALAMELSVVAASYEMPERAHCAKTVVFVLGNYGKRYVEEHYPALLPCVVMISNFVGFMLDAAVAKQFERVFLVGNLGKLVKVGGGIFHTHSKVADARNEILAAHYMLYSGNAKGFAGIMQSNTTEEALDYISELGFFDYFARLIQQRCEERIKASLRVEVLVFSLQKGCLGKSAHWTDWIIENQTINPHNV